ncbi:MAG TPA: SMP-30/gluconolactonase/LRE family protein, partial [Acetobacteraceae bacterium]
MSLSRRGVLTGAAALVPTLAFAQEAKPQFGSPPTVISQPPRQWGRFAPPELYPDPDVIVIDKEFQQYRIGLAAIHRLATGFQWAEGPAWSSEGQYAVFSDVKGDTQHRYLWDTERVSVFRKPSYNGNGNSFDFQGRQLSCQDFFRRVVRWEHDGSMTVLADSFDNAPLNSPNDIVPHPDGSVWFTDPPYGDQLSEGHPDVAGGPANPNGLYQPLIGDTVRPMGGIRRVLRTNTYRWDPSGRLDAVVTGAQVPDPNGLCFSPDYKTLY